MSCCRYLRAVERNTYGYKDTNIQQYSVLSSVLLSYTTQRACGFIDLEARASAAVPYRRRLSESPPCAQRAPHPPPRAARQPPAPARAQSRGQAWGWRHSTPWSGASPCLSPADTDDALLRLPERVTVPRNSTGSSSAPKSLCAARHTAGSVASTVILGTGKGKATLGSWV